MIDRFGIIWSPKIQSFYEGEGQNFGVHMNKKGLSQEKISLLRINSDIQRIIQ